MCCGVGLALSDAPILAPRPISPVQGVHYDGDPRAIRMGFQWRGATPKYRFQLAKDRRFCNVLVDRVLEDDGLDVTGLGAGEYFWRVAALSEEGKQGPFSEVQCYFLTTIQGKDRLPSLSCPALRPFSKKGQ